MEELKLVFCKECTHFLGKTESWLDRCCEPSNLNRNPIDRSKVEFRAQPAALNKKNACPHFAPRTTSQKVESMLPVFIGVAIFITIVLFFICC